MLEYMAVITADRNGDMVDLDFFSRIGFNFINGNNERPMDPLELL